MLSKLIKYLRGSKEVEPEKPLKIEPEVKPEKPVLKFKDLREKLVDALNKTDWIAENRNDFVFMDGFLSLGIYDETPSKEWFPKREIPSVAIVNIKSGEMHIFALRALLPELRKENE